MKREYLILKTTDKVSRAIDNRSWDDVYQSLIELHADMQKHTIDDESYDTILDNVDDLIKKCTQDINRLASDKQKEMWAEVEPQIENVIHQINCLYLRHSSANLSEEELNKIKKSDENLEDIIKGFEKMKEDRNTAVEALYDIEEMIDDMEERDVENMGSDWNGLDPETQESVNDALQNGDEYVDELKSMKEEFDNEFYNED